MYGALESDAVLWPLRSYHDIIIIIITYLLTLISSQTPVEVEVESYL